MSRGGNNALRPSAKPAILSSSDNGRYPLLDMTEKTLTTQEVYCGRIIRVRRDEVLLPNGNTSVREVVEHPGGVGILALEDDGSVLLVRQYRYAFGRTLLEIPAGKREKGEEPLTTARRELREETGATADEWLSMGSLIASPGCYDEVLYLYLARGLHFGDTHPDEDEFLSLERMPLEELAERCMNGEITDAKTVCAALKAKNLLR